MNRITVAIIIALLIGLGGIAVWTSLNTEKFDVNAYDTTKVIAADNNNGQIADHYRGKEGASIILVEYADLQCPGCATMMPKISKLYKEYGDRIGFVFRSYPIQGHPNARSASAAIESANKQGFFWETLEALYDNRVDWINVSDTEKRTNVYADIFSKATDGKGDVEKFKKDLNDSNIQKKIDFDKTLGGKKDKVTATPTIMINGEMLDIENTSDIAKLIEDKINEYLEKDGQKTGPAETEE